jgi:hypothetical protein
VEEEEVERERRLRRWSRGEARPGTPAVRGRKCVLSSTYKMVITYSHEIQYLGLNLGVFRC